MTMDRRSALKRGAAGAAAATLAAPAIVHAQPTIRWRMTSSFVKTVDILFAFGEMVSKRVSEATGGKFQISVHAAGEIVPAFQALDAVQAGNVECCHTALYYFFGKDPTWGFGTNVPFGLNTRQYFAWWHAMGGEQVFNEFANRNGVHCFVSGNTGAQMGGWFRKEINSLEDMKGLKFRVGGIAGLVISKLGGVPQQIPAGDIYTSLEKGTIDAAEWVGPYDDERLGFVKIAKYYYYPGWWEGSANGHMVVNRQALQSLPPEYRAILQAACEEAGAYVVARYDAQNGLALKRLIAAGAILKPFPRATLEAAYNAWQEIYADLAAKNADFKKVGESFFGAQREIVPWMRVSENSFDDFVASMRRS